MEFEHPDHFDRKGPGSCKLDEYFHEREIENKILTQIENEEDDEKILYNSEKRRSGVRGNMNSQRLSSTSDRTWALNGGEKTNNYVTLDNFFVEKYHGSGKLEHMKELALKRNSLTGGLEIVGKDGKPIGHMPEKEKLAFDQSILDDFNLFDAYIKWNFLDKKTQKNALFGSFWPKNSFWPKLFHLMYASKRLK